MHYRQPTMPYEGHSKLALVLHTLLSCRGDGVI